MNRIFLSELPRILEFVCQSEEETAEQIEESGIDIENLMERLNGLLEEDCVHIFKITGTKTGNNKKTS